MTTSTLPAGYHTATPYVIVRDAAAAISFYQQAFGATERMRLNDPAGKIAHAEIKIGDSLVMLSDEFPEYGAVAPAAEGGASSFIHLYCDDVDAVFTRAVAAGAEALMPVADQFYGDRSGRLRDPFGQVWLVSTRIEDVSPEEMQQRFDAMTGQAGEQ